MFSRIASGLLLRRMLREFSRIADALEQQNGLLTRLADHLAPVEPVTDRGQVRADTGVSHLDVDEMWLAAGYVERTQRDTGHVPDDEEILTYLADEKTTDLHRRLAEREVELARLQEERMAR